MPRFRLHAVSSTALLTLFSAGAHAQLALEEIVVTARKSEERLQRVPLTVTAFTESLIHERDIKDPYDLSRLAPGFNYQNNAGKRTNARLLMRGLSVATVASAKASAFIDGVFVSGDFSFLDFANVERIEVMPGPQSTQFGRSTFAGAFNFVTKLPTEEVSARLAGSVGTLGTTELSARVSGPLIGDRLLGQITGWHYHIKGPKDWINFPDGHRNGETKTNAATATLLLNASDSVRLIGRASYNRDADGNGTSYLIDPSERNGRFTKPNGTVAFYPVGQLPPQKYGINGQPLLFNYGLLTRPGLRRQQWRTNVQADLTLNDYEIRAIAAHNYETERSQLDGDFTFFQGSSSFQRQVRKDNSVELRASTPRDARFRAAAGGFYLKTVFEQDNLQILHATVSPTGAVVPSGARTPTRVDTTTIDRSAFGGMYYDLLDAMTVTFEARYQSEKLISDNLLTGRIQRATFNSFLPRVNIDYRFNDDVMVYAVYSKGNQPGAFNTSPFIGTPGSGTTLDMLTVKEEELFNYELGLKSTWLDGRILFNVAVFHLDWENQTAVRNYQAPTGQLFSVTQNLGSSDIDGFELETQALLGGGFDVRATASYYYSRYGGNVCSPNLANLLGRSDLPPPDNCIFVKGKRFEGMSPWQISISPGFEHSVGGGDWTVFVRGEYAYASRQFDSEMNLAWSAAAHVVSARIGVEGKGFTVELYGRNLTNERTYTRIGRFSDARLGASTQTNQNVAIVPRLPRQIGVRAIWEY
jgi:iron complex outermembrane receptor protein